MDVNVLSVCPQGLQEDVRLEEGLLAPQVRRRRGGQAGCHDPDGVPAVRAQVQAAGTKDYFSF